MTTASTHLLDLGRRVLDPYTRLPGARCAIISGSSAEGLSDRFSDLDMMVYYDALPPAEAIAAVREQVGGGPLAWSLGAHAEGEFVDSYRVRGVECQIVHCTLDHWQADMDSVLAGKDPGGPLHKAMYGTLVAVPIFGDEHLAGWKTRLSVYPDVLRVAMVRHHLKFFALWAVMDRLKTRDAHLWFRQTFVDASFNLIGVSAGLSRKYFTAFQFKRARAFFDSLTIAPPNLAERLEGLWAVPFEHAAKDLRALVGETVALVERELPEVDTAACRRGLLRKDEAWRD